MIVDKCINKVNSVDITEEPVSLEHKNIELKLDGGYFCESANEELLDLQKNEYDIMPHLLKKLYYNGLYGMQVSGMNGSGLYEAGVGYMWFILRQILTGLTMQQWCMG